MMREPQYSKREPTAGGNAGHRMLRVEASKGPHACPIACLTADSSAALAFSSSLPRFGLSILVCAGLNELQPV